MIILERWLIWSGSASPDFLKKVVLRPLDAYIAHPSQVDVSEHLWYRIHNFNKR